MSTKTQTVECNLDSRLIETKLIDVPKARPGERGLTKDFAIKLAASIKIDGMLQPIIVRPGKDGRYLLVAGKHRLYATRNVLKEQFIRAVVIDMDETEAELASITENLWRNPLSKPQHALAFKRWHEHWLAKHPALVDPKATAKVEEKDNGTFRIGKSNKAKAIEDRSETKHAEEVKAMKTATSEAAFDKTVADATGRSLTSVRKTKRIAEAFTPEQLEVFTQMSVNQTDMTTIAKIKDETKRSEVVSLVASGMEVEDALKEVMKENAPIRDYGGKTRAEAEAQHVAKTEAAPDLTDDEWFEMYCGEKAAMFKNPAKFKADALLFRSITDPRHAFRCKAKKTVAAIKKTSVYGAFWNLVNRFVSISHPKDWLICGECKGSGEAHVESGAPPAVKCPKCFGGGYLLKTEEYL